MTQDTTKHIVGLSCGRKNGNSEILLKEACMGAEEIGVGTEIIRVMELNLQPCNGCQACVTLAKDQAVCSIKDDMDWLFERILNEDDGLIISSPIFVLTITGHLKIINDRYLSRAFAFSNFEGAYHRKGVGASICVGGGQDEWTTMGLPFVNLFLLHRRKIVDQLLVNGAGSLRQVLLDEKSLRQARTLGQNVAKALKQPIDEVIFMGSKPKVFCPECYSNLLQVSDNLPQVRCPICNINGVISVAGGDMTVEWDDNDVLNSRFSEFGRKEHEESIKLRVKDFEKNKSAVKKLETKYIEFGRVTAP